MNKDIDALQEAISLQEQYIKEKKEFLTTRECIEEQYKLESMIASLNRLNALAADEESWEW